MNHLSNRNAGPMQCRGYRPSEDERQSRFGRVMLGIFGCGIFVVAVVGTALPVLSWVAARIGL